MVQGRCIHMSCRYIWRRIRRTRKRKAGGWREAGVAVDRGVNVYRQRLSAEKIFGGGGSLRPRTQREGDSTPLPDCSAAAEKAFEKGRRSKRKKRRTYFQKHVLRLISCWRPQGDLNPCRRRERPLSIFRYPTSLHDLPKKGRSYDPERSF